MEIHKMAERALLVSVRFPDISRASAEESMDELARLADTAGVEVVDRIIQQRERPDAAYFIGKGKVEEIAETYKALDLSCVIFDVDLSPAQTRNIEEAIEGKVIDRTRLILDIFAQHARTKEAMLEVELAQLAYQLPRLTRLWTHLSRQTAGAVRGGVGMRGPGEKQLEIDRRIIRNRMSNLKRALDKVKDNRKLERQGREGMFTIALVGYTNAGKSTLLNALANENLYTDDKLFSTLDPKTSVVHLSDNHNVLMTDTVGFIRNLPHHLIASFRATLEEVNSAHMLLHVADVSHPNVGEQIRAVEGVLKELGALNIPTLMVFNKIDKLEDMNDLSLLRRRYPNSVEVSALFGKGLDVLKAKLLEVVSENQVEVVVDIPQYEGRMINYVYKHGEVIEREFRDSFLHIRARMDKRYAGKLERFGALAS